MTLKISQTDGQLLIKLARDSILQALSKDNNHKKSEVDTAHFKQHLSSFILTDKRGTFVTLHKNRALRGCIGNIEPVKTIFSGVMENARHAAFNDSRFSPLSREEFQEIDIEVSILTPPGKVAYSDPHDLIKKLIPCIDGVIIKKRYHSATFLPQVWEQLDTHEQFLSHLCIKAGLDGDAWKKETLEVFKYQVQFFEESLP